MCLLNRYTVFSMFFQFLVPVVIISTIYIRILLYLKVRRLFLLQYNPQNHKFQIMIVLQNHKQQITNCGQITKGWQTSGCRAIECLCRAWFRNSEKQTWSSSPSQSLSSLHGFLSGISSNKKWWKPNPKRHKHSPPGILECNFNNKVSMLCMFPAYSVCWQKQWICLKRMKTCWLSTSSSTSSGSPPRALIQFSMASSMTTLRRCAASLIWFHQ